MPAEVPVLRAEPVQRDNEPVKKPRKFPDEVENDIADQTVQLGSEAKPKDDTALAVPLSHEQATTERLLETVVETLETLKKQGEVTAKVRKDEKRENRGKDINDRKRDYAAWTYQFISSGSIIAIFLSALNVALLSYANDIRSERDPPKRPKPTDKYVIACWTFSLVMSLAVVTSGSVWSFLYLWVTASRHTPPQRWHGPWIKLDRTRRPHTIADSVSVVTHDSSRHLAVPSRFHVLGVLSGIAFFFNLLVLPALVATIVGCIVFVWAEQPRLAAALTSACGATVFVAFWVVAVLVAGLASFRMRCIRITYEQWDEEKATLEKDKWQ